MSKSSSKRVRDPLIGINRRTAIGRQIRDLYRTRMAAIDIDEPDPTLQAAVRRAVELHLVGERMRAAMLSADTFDVAVLGELVRVENMVNRAEKHVAELVEKLPKPAPWWERQHEESHDGEEEA